MGYSLRLTLGLRRGEEVCMSFRKVKLEPARKVVLKLESPGKMYEFVPTPVMFIFDPFPAAGITLTPKERSIKEYVKEWLHYIKRSMLNTPYMKGDYIVLIPGMFMWADTEVVMHIVKTDPDTAVYVDQDTVLEVI